jgi:hypothetical protein
VVAAIVLAGLGPAACGHGGSSDATPTAPAAATCRPERTVHEHQLSVGGEQASFDGTTVVHLEPAGAVRHPRDTGIAGVDRIAYVVADRAVTRTFTIGDGPVARATVRGVGGATVANVARGATTRPSSRSPSSSSSRRVVPARTSTPPRRQAPSRPRRS